MARPSLQVTLLISATLGLMLLLSCALARKRPGNSSTDPVVSSTPPFQTKEPERYQAVRTITFTSATGESVTSRTVIAKDGPMRRDEYENKSSDNVVYLETDQGIFVMLPRQKLYAPLNPEPDPSGQEFPWENSPERLLNTETVVSKYQTLGAEVIDGRSTSKYQTVNTLTQGIVSNNETLIWIDEQLGLPIKSETTSADGSHTTMKLTDISLEVDKRLFQIPEGYEKVTGSVIRQRMSDK
jgi:outer membrane lipoprotein-sorting protein